MTSKRVTILLSAAGLSAVGLGVGLAGATTAPPSVPVATTAKVQPAPVTPPTTPTTTAPTTTTTTTPSAPTVSTPAPPTITPSAGATAPPVTVAAPTSAAAAVPASATPAPAPASPSPAPIGATATGVPITPPPPVTTTVSYCKVTWTVRHATGAENLDGYSGSPTMCQATYATLSGEIGTVIGTGLTLVGVTAPVTTTAPVTANAGTVPAA